MSKLNKVIGCAVAVLLLSQTITAHADDAGKYEEVLALSPGVSQAELESDIAIMAKESGRSEAAVLDELVWGARAASSDDGSPVDTNGNFQTQSSGDDGLGYQVTPGCSTTGNYTYSHARNYGQNHGHNAIYYAGCGLVHAPGPGQTVARVGSTYKYFSHPSYVALIRSPKNVTSTQRSSAGSFANSKFGLPYNLKFYANRIVNGSSYNCSQLVWAAWRSAAGIDLSGDNRTGIYPQDLRVSPLSSFIRNMARA